MMPNSAATATSAEEYLSCWRGQLEQRLRTAVGKALAEQPKDPCAAVALELLRGTSLEERAAALSAAQAEQEDGPQDDFAGDAQVGCTASKTNETELRKLRDENKLLKEEIQSLNNQSLKEKNQSLKQDEKPSLKDQLSNVSTPSATTSRDGKADAFPAPPPSRHRATAPTHTPPPRPPPPPEEQKAAAKRRPNELQPTSAARQARRSIGDPRWDRKGFDDFIAQAAPLVTVGFLRRLLAQEVEGVDPRTAVQEGDLHRTLPSDAGIVGVAVYAVLSASFGSARLSAATPRARATSKTRDQDPPVTDVDLWRELRALVAVLNEETHGALLAADDDLVFWDPLCVRPGSERAARAGMFRVFTHYRVQLILLPDSATSCDLSVFDRLDTMAYLALSTFCQRQLNTGAVALGAGVDLPTRLIQLPKTLLQLNSSSHAEFHSIATMLETVVRALQPVTTDDVGFGVLCEEAQIKWLRATYVLELEARGGVIPRYQDLEPHGVIVGELPKGRLLSVSHAWDSQLHVSPSGHKIARLGAALRGLGAVTAEDGLFLDYASLPQAAPWAGEAHDHYVSHLGLEDTLPLLGRSDEQSRRFGFALWEMSRIYAYSKMEVVVLPQPAQPSAFPCGPTAWGLVGQLPYCDRGWCCSEYSIARLNGRIVNESDADVREVEDSRSWPTTVEEYSTMMDVNAARPVGFTKKGDRDAVCFIFYRVCFGMRHAFLPDEFEVSGCVLPTHEDLRAVDMSLVGRGDAITDYYVYTVLPRPPVALGDNRVEHAELIRHLKATLLTSTAQSELTSRDKYPLAISDGTELRTPEAIGRIGRLHCLLWIANGVGFEQTKFGDDPPQVDALISSLAALGSERLPHVVIVCTRFGAWRAGTAVSALGVGVVVWMQLPGATAVSDESASKLLLGVVQPLLERIAEPFRVGSSSAGLSKLVNKEGLTTFGRGWQQGGCLVGDDGLPPLAPWVPSDAARAAWSSRGCWLHDLTVSAAAPSSVGSRLLAAWSAKEQADALAAKSELHEAITVHVTDSTGQPVPLISLASQAPLLGQLLSKVGDAAKGGAESKRKLGPRQDQLQFARTRAKNDFFHGRPEAWPLHWACINGEIDEVRRLIVTDGHSPNERMTTLGGAPPLNFAAGMGYYAITELLIELHADLTMQGSNGDTPLSLAKRERHHQVARLLETHSLSSEAAVNAMLVCAMPRSCATSMSVEDVVPKIMANRDARPSLCFVNKDSPLRCIFKHADALRKGETVPMTLLSPSNCVGAAPKSRRPRSAAQGEWSVMDLMVDASSVACHWRLTSDQFLLCEDDDVYGDFVLNSCALKLNVGEALEMVHETATENRSRLLFVKRDDPNRVILEHAKALKRGDAVPTSLKLAKGSDALKYFVPKDDHRIDTHGPWRVAELCVGPTPGAFPNCTCRLNDDEYLVFEGDGVPFAGFVLHSPFQKFHPGHELILLAATEANTIRLCYVRRDDPRRCVFDHAAGLRAGRTVPMTFTLAGGSQCAMEIAPETEYVSTHGEWKVVNLNVRASGGSGDPAMCQMKQDANGYLLCQGEIDYAGYAVHPPHLRVHAGHELIALNNVDPTDGGLAKMKREFNKFNQWKVEADGTISSVQDASLCLGASQDPSNTDPYAKMRNEFHLQNQWVVNDDGSVSSKFEPEVCLGLKVDVSAKYDPHARIRREFADKVQWVVHDDGSISHKLQPELYIGLRFEPSPICALYDDDVDPARPSSSIQLFTHVGDVGFLHSLRDSVLSDDFDQKLKLAAEAFHLGELTFRVDRSAFTLAYEASVLAMDKLTLHQQEKLEECSGAPYVHLRAPAGAGKTFVALHRILEVLTQESGKPATVCFVACNLALCLFVGRWLCKRVKNTLLRAAMLRRMHVLFLPFEQGPQALSLENGRLERTPASFLQSGPQSGASPHYSLLVVDEAHHVFTRHAAAMARYLPPTFDADRQLILLSDASQSTASGIAYPAGSPREVLLTEVVRSSQRIVAGAGAFQLAVDKATSHHGAEGPPLKAFIFSADADDRFDGYASHVIKAIEHIRHTLGDVPLHDRLAIVVPDDAFAAELRPWLEAALFDEYPERNFVLVDAMEAAASAVNSHSRANPQQSRVREELSAELAERSTGLGESSGAASEDSGWAHEMLPEEWIVLSPLADFDGLERLAVIACGLDSVIDDGGDDDDDGSSAGGESQAAFEARGRIYRALTRAHMLAMVVNEALPSGWLEFLQHIKLRPGKLSAESLAMSEFNALGQLGLARPAVTYVASLNYARVASYDEQSVTVRLGSMSVYSAGTTITFKRVSGPSAFSHFEFPGFYTSLTHANQQSTFAFRQEIATHQLVSAELGGPPPAAGLFSFELRSQEQLLPRARSSVSAASGGWLIVQNVHGTTVASELAAAAAQATSAAAAQSTKRAAEAGAKGPSKKAPVTSVQQTIHQKVWDAELSIVGKPTGRIPKFLPFKVCTGGDHVTVYFGADDLFDEIYYNGVEVSHEVEKYATDANELKKLHLVNAGTEAVLALAVHDYEPGTSACFFLRAVSDDPTSAWSDYSVKPGQSQLGTVCYGLKGTGKHANGTHRDMRNKQRPAENAPPAGWFENDFDDSAWGKPTPPTCADWAEKHEMTGVWYKEFKYTFYRVKPQVFQHV